jgi:hypothetical protein
MNKHSTIQKKANVCERKDFLRTPSIIIPFCVNKPFLLYKHLFYWTSLFMDYLLNQLMRSLITTTFKQPYFTYDMQQMFQISTPKLLMTLLLILSTSTSKFFIYKFLKERKLYFHWSWSRNQRWPIIWSHIWIITTQQGDMLISLQFFGLWSL